jgi:predicted transposase YdaD
MQYDYRVIRLWEADPSPLLADAGLLPLATLARSDAPEKLLRQVAEQVDKIESIEQRQNLAAAYYDCCNLR